MTVAGEIDWIVTVIVALLAAVLVGWANWRSNKPYEPGSEPLVPLGLIQFLGLTLLLLSLAHAVSLITGTPFEGRVGR